MRCPGLGFLSLCWALVALGQHPVSDRIVLPADKTDADVTLLLPPQFPKDAKMTFLLVDSKAPHSRLNR